MPPTAVLRRAGVKYGVTVITQLTGMEDIDDDPYYEGDPHDEIVRLEAHIEELAAKIESCLRSARSRASVRSSSAAASLLYPATSVARMAASFRVSGMTAPSRERSLP